MSLLAVVAVVLMVSAVPELGGTRANFTVEEAAAESTGSSRRTAEQQAAADLLADLQAAD